MDKPIAVKQISGNIQINELIAEGVVDLLIQSADQCHETNTRGETQ
jgi:hypothetical protein